MVLAVVEIAFLIFSFVDVLLTDDSRVRGLPKVVWVFVVILVTPIGGILWFLLGKEPAVRAARATPVAPDDDPDFLRRLGTQEDQDERIRRLEQELADLDDDQPDTK